MEKIRMRIPKMPLENVVFLVDQGTPRATGFLVAIPHQGTTVAYIVTARHCIEETAGRDFQIRINIEDRFDEISTKADEWFLHPTADVAAMPFVGGPSPRYDVK